MSELVLATADICLHGTSSTLCEWCNYKSRIPHLESQLRDAVAEIKRLRATLERIQLPAGVSTNFEGKIVDDLVSLTLSEPTPESLKPLLSELEKGEK